jgi:hypothetical protein
MPGRNLGLQAGVDIALGPEDSLIYLTVCNAWVFQNDLYPPAKNCLGV